MYILSFKHQGHFPELCFWRANDKGYTNNLLEAGKYTKEEVLANLDHYHSGPNSVAVPEGVLPDITAKLVAAFRSSMSDPVIAVEVWPVPGLKEELIAATRRREVVLTWIAPDRFIFRELQKSEPITG